MTALGLCYLSGDPDCFDHDEGAGLLNRAAALGDAEAHHGVAVLAAAGVCQPQNWELAISHLLTSAELGWQHAREQCRLLQFPKNAAAARSARSDIEDGAQYPLDTIDIAAWLKPPVKRVICDAPRVRTIEHFLPQSMCDWIIQRARHRLRPARVYDATTGGSSVVNTRTNTEVDFNIVETDLILLLVQARIAAATGLPTIVMELTKVLHYAPGQAFFPHYDFIDPHDTAFTAERQLRGQRLVTFLLYLNEGYEGGETDFPTAGIRYKGRTGDALYFANVDVNGDPDRRTLHAGLAPATGEKWLLSQWIRDRAPRRA